MFSIAYRMVQKINIGIKRKVVERENPSEEKKILEIGAGTGDFLTSCQKHGWKCYGVEPSDQAREVAKDYNQLKLFSSIEEIGEKNFSVITLWHVLEHIPNLNETITKLNKLLTPSGTLIIAVPNYNSFDAKHYKQFWAGYDVPRHLYHFNKDSLKILLSSNGFELRTIKPMWFDSFYVSLLSEKYKHNKLIIRYLLVIFIGTISNISSLFTKEFSSQIFIFRKTVEK